MTEQTSELLRALYSVYPDASNLMNPATAHMVVEGQRLVSKQNLPGVEIEAEEGRSQITIHLRVAEGVQVAQPIHSCVGLMTTHGAQRIRLYVKLESGASAHLLSHCLFPTAERIKHEMDAVVSVGEGANLLHTEGHFHGPFGGIEVRPHAEVRVLQNGRYFSDFSLTGGRVGVLDVGYRVSVEAGAVAEITARVYGHGDDSITLRDEMNLEGKNARGLIKTRVALEGDAISNVIGITHGNAEGARGHMECTELVRERARARAEPVVNVAHPGAKVTHEAAIGSVDHKQLETLMAHGLTPDEAVEVIIMSLLR
ncbi:MAG: SufD family Fe-S cluster assembly protein [Pseudomonadota bacterium]